MTEQSPKLNISLEVFSPITGFVMLSNTELMGIFYFLEVQIGHAETGIDMKIINGSRTPHSWLPDSKAIWEPLCMSQLQSRTTLATVRYTDIRDALIFAENKNKKPNICPTNLHHFFSLRKISLWPNVYIYVALALLRKVRVIFSAQGCLMNLWYGEIVQIT